MRVWTFIPYFGCNAVYRAQACVSMLRGFNCFAKVTNNCPGRVQGLEEDVLERDVSMHDSILMECLQASQNPLHEEKLVLMCYIRETRAIPVEICDGVWRDNVISLARTARFLTAMFAKGIEDWQ